MMIKPGGQSAVWLQCVLSQRTMVGCETKAGPDCNDDDDEEDDNSYVDADDDDDEYEKLS